MDDGADVAALVLGALSGDHDAWNNLVHRYAPLVTAVLVRHRLSGADADDVGQVVWLRLVEHLRDLREPRALPRWIITTTRNECLRLINARRRVVPFDPLTDQAPDGTDPATADGPTLLAERHEALLAALAELPERQRAVLLLQFGEPEISYLEISERLGIPVGSIGPTRARAIAKLRTSPVLQELGLVRAGGEHQGGGQRDIAAIGGR